MLQPTVSSRVVVDVLRTRNNISQQTVKKQPPPKCVNELNDVDVDILAYRMGFPRKYPPR